MRDITNFLSQYSDELNLLGVLANFIGVVSVISIYFSSLESRKIIESISTKYIGSFPETLPEVSSLIKKARKSIVILWDAADPGSFVDTEEHIVLLNGLIAKKKQGLDIKYLIPCAPQAISTASIFKGNSNNKKLIKKFITVAANDKFRYEIESLSIQIGMGDKYTSHEESIKKIFTLKSCDFGGIKEDNYAALSIIQLCYHRFVENIIRDNKIELRSGSYTLTECVSNPDMFFVLCDDKFGLLFMLSPGMDAITFITEDRKLISSLKNNFMSRWESFSC